MKKLLIFGAGSQAKECLNTLIENGFEKNIDGFLVSGQKNNLDKYQCYPVYNITEISDPRKYQILIAIGNSIKRLKVFKELSVSNFDYYNLIHNSVIKGTVDCGTGIYIGAGSILTTDIKLGSHVLINIGVRISHDVEIGDFVTIAPGVNISGNVKIKHNSWIGVGSVVKENITIGKNCFVGAGSVVVHDLPDNCLAYGVPAKPIKKLSKSDFIELV